MFSICSVACSKEMEKGIWEIFLKQKLLDKSHDGPKETWKGKWVASWWKGAIVSRVWWNMYFGSHHGKRFALSDSKEACPLLGEEACPSLELVTAVCTLHFFFVFFIIFSWLFFCFVFNCSIFWNFQNISLYIQYIYISLFLFLFSRNFKFSEIYKLINLSFFENYRK